jgi:hypothetical protein
MSLEQEVGNKTMSTKPFDGYAKHDRSIELARLSTDEARLFAASPTTSPELLRQLSLSGDRITRSHVAANPNTPTDVLLALCKEFPKEVLGNAVFPLLFLENPDLIEILDTIPAESLWSIVLDTQTSQEILGLLIHNKNSPIAQAAQLHVNWAGEMNAGWDEAAQAAIRAIGFVGQDWRYLQQLIELGINLELGIKELSNDGKLMYEIASNPKMPERILQRLVEATDDWVRRSVGSKTEIPLILQESLVKDFVYWSEQWLNFNSNLSMARLQELAWLYAFDDERSVCEFDEMDKAYALMWRDRKVREGVASNPQAPVHLLEYLANDLAPEIRQQVVTNVKTPVNILEQLACDRDDKVRASVASCANTPVKLLEPLAQDASGRVRQEVAQNPKTPVSILEQLIGDCDQEVRRSIAFNTNAPANVLSQLPSDSDNWVRQELARCSRTPVSLLQQLASDANPEVRQFVACNSSTPVSVLEQLASDANPEVRRTVASNTKTPTSILEQLASDANPEVRRTVASNTKTPTSILEQLADDRDRRIRLDFSLSSETPVSVLEQLVSDCDPEIRRRFAANSSIPANIVERCVSDRDCRVRQILASRSDTSASILEQLASDRAAKVRRKVASNTNTPAIVLEQLTKDPDERVRRLADCTLTRICQLIDVPEPEVCQEIALDSNTPMSILEERLHSKTSQIDPVALQHYLADNPEDLPLVLELCAKKFSPLCRLFVLLHPQTPSQALANYCHSQAWLERYAIAQNPNTPIDTLKALAEDANRIVRAAAQAKLGAA